MNRSQFWILFIGSCLALASAHPAVIVPHEPNSQRAEVCCGDLGCFTSGGPFQHLLYRPIDSVPNCNVIDKLVLHLNTRQNPQATQVIDPYNTNTIDASNFNPSKGTKILIHGYLEAYFWPWWTQTVQQLLSTGDYNVIRVDWSRANTFPYTQASANARLVGAYLAKLVILLRDHYNVDPANVHVIGLSLGAHVAGYTGEAVMTQSGGKIGRITGLDPAGPFFQNMPEIVRLDPSDATAVDTIVSDGEFILNTGLILALGSSQPMGHINFYPNGGKDQTGCESGPLSAIINGLTNNLTDPNLIDLLAAGVFETIACSHGRAVTLFIDSISNGQSCTMKSYQCDTYEKFLRGECFECSDSRCTSLGYYADMALAEAGTQKNFYTLTTGLPPFCTQFYRIVINLQPKSSANNARKEDGWIYVTFYGLFGVSERIQLNEDSMDFEPGSHYSWLARVNHIGPIQSVVIYWEADSSLFNPLDWFRNINRHSIR